MARPRKYETEELLQEKIDAYFKDAEDKKEIANKAGLCLFLDIHRDTYNAWKQVSLFSDTIKKVELRIENAWIQRLTKPQPVGAIFYMKNAFKEDYKDRTESEVTHVTPQPILDVLRSNDSRKEDLQPIQKA